MTDDRLERISRGEMQSEFGAPGVQNPNVIDQIAPEGDGVVLVMIEKRRFGSVTQLHELEEKLNRYLGYVLDGYLAQHYPEWAGRPVQIRLDCVEAPHGDARDLLAAAAETVEAEGLALRVNVLPPDPEV